ncbi:alpha-N-acetylglucosaminidase [Coprobacter tertius]|uniref:Alpha-N-acetylglucosaminidase n=1 Tax=Coprobacter tertius TaxID=2944915 RepID=A0ABT1MJI1_9BACT|nr:alpha-N-acetylglucosaminidase [Coprobacter tertius]MCP9612777.1 alpha-N-acetylglucosaminidase [Coprobacter tertius]
MRKVLLSLLIFTTVYGCSSSVESDNPCYELAKRLLPDNAASFFIFEKVPSESDFFELEQTEDNKIVIRGNNGISIARGLNHYLRNYCHKSVSWCGNNLSELPVPLPPVREKIKISASFPYRYYLNYCTYSYSMAFWDWKQWEKEIDRMALQGINMPLVAVYGQYAVWQNTLRRLNFNEDEIRKFLPGAGYEAWWLMGNLEGFGGPVTPEFIARQTDLQHKMLKRMRELGMKPVFQGFYGMVPNALKEKYPDARIKSQGKWCTFQRPAFLDPTDPLFEKIAAIYYDEQKKLFGEAQFFGGDPFHEGGTSEGIDVKLAAQKILQSMRKVNPQAIWVLQGWQRNPAKELIEGLKPGEVIILDLMACERPQWGGIKTSFFYKPEGHLNHQWIWCALPNFGGKTGLHGIMSSYASGPVFAKHHPMGKNLCGIGTAPEGIGTLPVVYDMVYDMAWRTDSIHIPEWIDNYTYYRYGTEDNNCKKAWKLLSESIYECHNQIGGPVESYICARPADTIKHASAWGTTELFYDPMKIVKAWELLYQSRKRFDHSDTYEYDLTDVTRQVLSDYAKYLHKEMTQAFQKKDKKRFMVYSGKFLDIIKDVDRLLTTRKEFMLGTWLADAEKAGCSPEEKRRFVTNAKRQITTWTDTDTDLHDYANKEWSGLLTDFYLPRWEAYVTYKTGLLYGGKMPYPDYSKMEQEWVLANSTYLTRENPEGTIAVVEDLYKRYHTEIEQNYQKN